MKKCNDGLGLLVMSFVVFFGLATLAIYVDEHKIRKPPEPKPIRYTGCL